MGYEGEDFALQRHSMDAKVPREWMQDARQVVGLHEIISNCAAYLYARALDGIGSLAGVENLTTEESVGQGYTLYSADFTLPIALESTAEEALATPPQRPWFLAEAVKKIPVAEAIKTTAGKRSGAGNASSQRSGGVN